MRLSWGEGRLVAGLVLCCLLLAWVPYAHTEVFLRTIQGNDHLVKVISQPMQEMASWVDEQPVSLTKWTVYFRGTLSPEEREEWLQHLLQQGYTPGRTRQDERGWTSTQWIKSESGYTHSVLLIDTPHDQHRPAKYIYAWSGHTQPDHHWLARLERLTHTFFSDLHYFPEFFTCLEAITNGTLENGFVHKSVLNQWLTAGFKAHVVHQVSEPHFISLNGYVPSWDHFLHTADQKKINIQLSARYNALDQKTRITMGYPLILTAH